MSVVEFCPTSLPVSSTDIADGSWPEGRIWGYGDEVPVTGMEELFGIGRKPRPLDGSSKFWLDPFVLGEYKRLSKEPEYFTKNP